MVYVVPSTLVFILYHHHLLRIGLYAVGGGVFSSDLSLSYELRHSIRRIIILQRQHQERKITKITTRTYM